jgi:hypothetical protein
MLPTTPSTSNPWARGTGDKQAPIDRLYARLEGMYLGRWRANFHTPEAIEAWAEAWSDALTRHRVTPKQAFAALQALELGGDRPPPTLPEFLALCQPPRLDYYEAFVHAVRNMAARAADEPGEWPEPAIYWAALDFGPYELRTLSYKQAETGWRRCLDRRRAAACPDVPPVMVVLPAPALDLAGKAMTSDEAKAAAMEAIAGMTGRAPSRRASRERARAFLAAHQDGKPVTLAQLAWAQAVERRLAQVGEDA